MNTNNIFLSLFLLLSFTLIVSCASNTQETPEEIQVNANTVSVETSTPTIKVDSAKIKAMIAEKEAELEAEKERLALEAKEKAKAEAAAKKKAAAEKKRVAELKRKKAAEEKRKAEEAAAAQASIAVTELPVSQPVVKPAPAKPVSKKGPKISFTTKTHNFGTIKEGDVVKYEFEYTNTGTEELVIKDASATCGCTAPGFSFFPLAPGLSSAVSVTFNSANKAGAQRPEVTIITNGYPSKHILTLEGTVE